MQKKNTSLTFYQKTQNLCEMHKNRQNSVDFISNICLHVGMDARELKKQITYEALRRLRNTYVFDKSPVGQESMLVTIMDIEQQKITQAKKDRFLRVLDQMLDNAESKI